MKKTRNCLPPLLALAAAICTQGAVAAEPQHISFVACPIVQDTNIVPCWLAEYEGETYFLGIQTDSGGWQPPLQGHQLLVEGVVTDSPRVCGGIVLASPGTVFDRRPSGSVAGVELPNPPVTSPLRELDNNCREVRPENPQYNVLEPRRGPGPSNPAPPRTPEQVAQAQRDAAARAEAEKPVPPYQPKTFEVHYEFDSELAALTINKLQEALRYAAAIGASSLEVVAYRASSLLSNGQQLEEIPAMARLRAKELENVIRQFGLPQGTELKVRWEDAVQPGNGVDDWTRRRSDLIVNP